MLVSHLQGKPELRNQFRDRRRSMTPAMRQTASQRAATVAHAWLLEQRPKRVALFASIADEIDTAPLFALLRNDGVEVVLPRVRAVDTSLDFVLVDDLNDLVPGPFRLLEPRGPAVPLASVDIVVVPGLAFDASGARLGYGAGYYDRALSDFAGRTLGYCFRFQLVDAGIPVGPHDRPMTAIATEGGVHTVGTP